MNIQRLKIIVLMAVTALTFTVLTPDVLAQGLPTSGGTKGINEPCIRTSECDSRYVCNANNVCGYTPGGTGQTGSGTKPAPAKTNDTFNGGIDLTANDVYYIIVGLACYLEDIGISLAILAIAYSGLLYMTSQGNTAQITKAKTALGYSILGLAVIIGVYVIISTVANGVGAKVSFFTCKRELVPTTSEPVFLPPEE